MRSLAHRVRLRPGQSAGGGRRLRLEACQTVQPADEVLADARLKDVFKAAVANGCAVGLPMTAGIAIRFADETSSWEMSPHRNLVHANPLRARHTNRPSRASRKIKRNSAREGPAVVNDDSDRSAVRGICNRHIDEKMNTH
jgi:hypothetical protein